ncbi:MAG: diguanylate cyclase [Acidobacteria bacterium]|nr:diguanylate cyclase [Acidobacteriota bacterium]MCG3194705.1 Response regulator PleD [Thermoanaerobaculia bacterium]MCK6683618.1 diguanylate cyclase [Thermoanaerobaculia bacterium]
MSSTIAQVLVVEDDPVYREQMEIPLRQAGFQVESCPDGQAALERVRVFRPEVVVTDWEMPRLDGLTLCRLIKGIDELRFTHVIILSSRGETASKVAGLDTGADDYLVKPVDPNELVARVRSGLRLVRALSELAAKNELLERLALTDPLTSLPNRRAFEESLSREVSRAQRSGRPLSLLILDLDHFKSINDSFGHGFGDEILVGFARLLARQARRGDMAARIGGEEFAVLLPMTEKIHAITVGERIRRACEGTPLGRTQQQSVTVSVGAATTKGTAGSSPAELVDEADRALYRAKAEGRNRVFSL